MQMSNLKVPISLGELIDKITILRIKSNKINSNEAQKNIRSELEKLEHILNTKISVNTNLKNFEIKLSKINQTLWDIEDQLREKEREKKFDKNFISLARMVYYKNDERAKIKRMINKSFGSELIEEKSLSTTEKIRIISIDNSEYLLISNKGKKSSFITLDKNYSTNQKKVLPNVKYNNNSKLQSGLNLKATNSKILVESIRNFFPHLEVLRKKLIIFIYMTIGNGMRMKSIKLY